MDYKFFNTMDEIRSLGKSETQIREELYALWRDCFGDTAEYTDFYFEWKVKNNRIVTIYKQNRLSSMLHLNPYTVKTGKGKMNLNYIVGVATRAEDRRQGLMKVLLETSLQQMYKEHMPFTYLMPAAEAIYRPFGFRTVYKQASWRRQLSETFRKGKKIFSELKREDLKAVRVDSGNEKAIELLTDFTNRHLAAHYDIYTIRSPYYYKRLIHEMESGKGGVLLCLNQDTAVGYMAYMTDGGFGIAECIYRQEEEAEFMGAMAAEIPEIYLEGEPDKEHSEPVIMTRVIDFIAFLEGITSAKDFILNVEVKDAIIKENNGVYCLEFTGNGCKGVRTNTEPELTADISELTSLFFGRLSEQEVLKLSAAGDGREAEKKIREINFLQKVFINDVV